MIGINIFHISFRSRNNCKQKHTDKPFFAIANVRRQLKLSLDFALIKPNNINNTVKRELDDIINKCQQLKILFKSDNIKIAQKKMNKHGSPILCKQRMHL